MRVVSLLSSLTESVYAMGLQDLLVGRSHECDYPPEVTALPQCTEPRFATDGTSYAIDARIKAILQEGLSVYRVFADQLDALKPDVILTQTQCEVCAVSLSDVEEAVCNMIASRPRIVSVEPRSLADVYEGIRAVAEALEHAPAGEALIRRMQDGFDRVARTTNSASARPRVAHIEWIDPIMPAGNWIPELAEIAGGENLFGEPCVHSGVMDWQTLRNADPDVIAVFPCGWHMERAREEMTHLTHQDGWEALQAVRDGRVYLTDGNRFFNRPGPRLVESAEILAEMYGTADGFGHAGKNFVPFATAAP